MLVMEKAGFALSNLFLLCLDKETVSVIDGAAGDVRCVEVSGVSAQPHFHPIWQLRAKVLACLVGEGGRDVILSDNDALWIKSPLENLNTVEGDLVVQRGTMPARLGDPVYGVTICMGFAVFRSQSEGMPVFLDEMLRVVNKVGDDQVAVNQAARSLHMDWIYDEGVSDMRYLESTQAGYGVLTDLPGNFTVTFLPHNKYRRSCGNPISPETFVAHCFSKYHHDREQEMKDHGVWLLD